MMNALVLGLLISTAKSSYDVRRTEVADVATDAILADRSLALCGTETKEARIALHQFVASLMDHFQLLRGEAAATSSSKVKSAAADFYQSVRKLSAHSDEQKALQAEVLRISLEVAEIRAVAPRVGIAGSRAKNLL
jgi:hypothetical protein